MFFNKSVILFWLLKKEKNGSRHCFAMSPSRQDRCGLCFLVAVFFFFFSLPFGTFLSSSVLCSRHEVGKKRQSHKPSGWLDNFCRWSLKCYCRSYKGTSPWWVQGNSLSSIWKEISTCQREKKVIASSVILLRHWLAYKMLLFRHKPDFPPLSQLTRQTSCKAVSVFLP